jgi:hypothetical protein
MQRNPRMLRESFRASRGVALFAALATVGLVLSCSDDPESPDTQAPQVTITAPLDGDTLSTVPTLVEVTAADNRGVARVDFYADSTLLGSATQAPFAYSWAWGMLGDDELHDLRATAVDKSGNTASNTVHVTLKADREPPEVAITTTAGSVIDASASITAGATDAYGVAVVRFYVGDVLAGSDTQAPFEQPALALLYWADGSNHDVAAEAEDFAGNTQRSAAVAISIAKPATAWLSDVLAVAGPGSADGHPFDRLVRLNPEVRYRGTKIDTIDVSTCIQGNTALIDYEALGCFFVVPVPPPDTTRFHIDSCILINARNGVRPPPEGQTLGWGGAIEFVDHPLYYTLGQVTHCSIYRSAQSGVYMHISRPDCIVIKNNVFVENGLGGCVRYENDVTPIIQYNCASQNTIAQFGWHCGCPNSVQPTELDITDPQEQLGTNNLSVPYAPMIKNRPRTQREHFVLQPDSPCRYAGEDGTYQGAMPPDSP